MSLGTPRITIRVPEVLIEAMDSVIKSRNQAKAADREWSRTDWIVEAITEKLNKTGYGRKLKLGIRAIKYDDNMPREVEGDVDELM